MKKILVPTDFSTNSKNGVRFAIHWATQQKLDLVFIHVLHVLRPTRWSDSVFEKYMIEEIERCKVKLEKYIHAIYKKMNVNPGNHSFEIIQGIGADVSLLDYCRRNKTIDYICICTRGAGKLSRIFGTNTGNLITKSEVPVLAVPGNYRVAPIRKVMYASDFRNYTEELKKVIEFSLPLKAKIDVLHYTWPHEFFLDKDSIETELKKQYSYGIKLHLEKNDAVQSLIQNLQSQVRIKKPSVVIMFTKRNRTFFEKIFLSSKSEELSFKTKVPLLVYNKF